MKHMKPSDFTMQQIDAIDDLCRAMFGLAISSVDQEQLKAAAQAAGVEWK